MSWPLGGAVEAATAEPDRQRKVAGGEAEGARLDDDVSGDLECRVGCHTTSVATLHAICQRVLIDESSLAADHGLTCAKLTETRRSEQAEPYRFDRVGVNPVVRCFDTPR